MDSQIKMSRFMILEIEYEMQLKFLNENIISH